MARKKQKDKSELVKMSKLVELSGVPAPTIKHYIREGLLPEPALRTSPNMAYYDADLVPRIQAIKDLQRTHFLPLKVIKDILEGARPGTEDQLAVEAIARVLEEESQKQQKTRSMLLEAGHPVEEIDWLRDNQFIIPELIDGEETYSGEDISLLMTLLNSRRAGLTAEMLPTTILEPYREAIQKLVMVELELFRSGVIPRAAGEIPELTEVATRLSESLVIHLRRKALIPVLTALANEPKKE